jgi:hypothetical protein
MKTGKKNNLPSRVQQTDLAVYTQKRLEIILSGSKSVGQKCEALVKAHWSGEIKLDSIRTAYINKRKELEQKVVKAIGTILVYYPDASGYLTSPELIEEFCDALNQRQPQILIEEIPLIVKNGMQTYKYHTSPKLNDLLNFFDEYQSKRVDLKETFEHNHKALENNHDQGYGKLLSDVYVNHQDEIQKTIEEQNAKQRKSFSEERKKRWRGLFKI